MTAASRPPARQPWPMWPVALAIVVCLAGYTYFRLAYAKPTKAHEPFADNRRRVESAQLGAAGWSRVDAAYEPVVELPAAAATVRSLVIRPAAAEDLHRLSAENWHLPIEYTTVAAPSQLAAGVDAVLHFQAELDQARAHIVGFDLYRKDADLVLLPRWEPYPEELVPRRPRITGRITLPAAALPPGPCRVTLPALRQSSQWDLVVAPAGG